MHMSFNGTYSIVCTLECCSMLYYAKYMFLLLIALSWMMQTLWRVLRQWCVSVCECWSNDSALLCIEIGLDCTPKHKLMHACIQMNPLQLKSLSNIEPYTNFVSASASLCACEWRIFIFMCEMYEIFNFPFSKHLLPHNNVCCIFSWKYIKPLFMVVWSVCVHYMFGVSKDKSTTSQWQNGKRKG